MESSCNPIVNKPKPKVEPPKDDDKDKKATTEEKMDDNDKNSGAKSEEATAPAQPQAAEEMDVDWH